MHYPIKCGKRRPGFTLVELLVVISILAILATILIPVIQSINRNAAISKNLSNLRHFQTANQLYANEHGGNYVPVGSFDENGSYGNFWHRNAVFAEQYLGVKDVHEWPDELLSPWATLRDNRGRLRVERSYGYNYTGLGGFGTPSTTRQARQSQLVNPSNTLAFADALDWQIQIAGADRYRGEEADNTSLNSAIAYRYDDRAGVVFFDGHTALLSRDEVVNNVELWNIVLEN